MREDEVIQLLKLLEEFYPGRVGSGELELTLRAWHLALMDAESERVLANCMKWVRMSNPFPPLPGDLLAEPETGRLTPEEAWGLVAAAIREVGGLEKPDLPAGVLAAAEAVGGPWGSMCRGLESRDVPSLRARFIDAFKNTAKRDRAVAIEQGAEGLVARLGASGIGLIEGL